MIDDATAANVRELAQLRQAVNASSDVIFMTDADGIGRLTPRILKSGESSPEHYSAMWSRLKRGLVTAPGVSTHRRCPR